MKRNEAAYLEALQSFSKPVRAKWDVLWLDGDNFDLRFQGPSALYQFWDATKCVEFGFQMVRQALEIDLVEETHFLAQYDRIYEQVNNKFDVRSDDLSLLISACIENGGIVSIAKRKRFAGRVQPEALDFIEQCTQSALLVNLRSQPATGKPPVKHKSVRPT